MNFPATVSNLPQMYSAAAAAAVALAPPDSNGIRSEAEQERADAIVAKIKRDFVRDEEESESRVYRGGR